MTKQGVVELINKVLRKYPSVFELVGNISENDIEAIEHNNSILGYSEKNKLKNFVFSLLKDKIQDEGLFYHYLKYDYAKQILQRKEIQLSALSHYIASDPFEYSELYRNFITFHQSNYIEKEKNNLFVFCMTEDCRNDYMWKHYADKGKGIVLGFRFSMKADSSYHFRNVLYDDGESLEFLKEINFYLHKENLSFFPEGISTVSLFYKRNKFSQEKEVRLCFDFTGINELLDQNTALIQSIKEEENRRYLPLPFENNLFPIDLCEVICGENVSHLEYKSLKTLISKDVKIWKKK